MESCSKILWMNSKNARMGNFCNKVAVNPIVARSGPENRSGFRVCDEGVVKLFPNLKSTIVIQETRILVRKWG